MHEGGELRWFILNLHAIYIHVNILLRRPVSPQGDQPSLLPTKDIYGRSGGVSRPRWARITKVTVSLSAMRNRSQTRPPTRAANQFASPANFRRRLTCGFDKLRTCGINQLANATQKFWASSQPERPGGRGQPYLPSAPHWLRNCVVLSPGTSI